MHARLSEVMAHADESGLFFDYDGTLSEIVDIPSEARPLEGVPEILARLARKYEVVAVVSGRRAADLLTWLGPHVEIHGLHGAEIVQHGRTVVAQVVEPHAARIEDGKQVTRRRLDALALEGVIFEDKGPIFALHYRTARDRDRAVVALSALAADVCERYGLVRADGREVIEIRPPIELSKASVVEARARSARLHHVVFVGDDAVDLPAFDALDRLGEDGMSTIRVAVESAEAPADLLARADLVLPGPRAVLELLKELAS